MVAELLQAIVRRALASGLSLAATSYLAHQLGRDQLGSYIGMLSLGQLLAGVTLLGLDAAPVYLIRTYPAQARRIWHYATLLSLALAAACMLLAAAAHGLGPGLGVPESRLRQWGTAPFAYAASFLLLQPQWACLQGLLRLRSFNVLQVVYPLAFLVSAAVLGGVGDGLNPLNTLYVWCAVNLLSAVAAFGLVARARDACHADVSKQDRKALHAAFLRFAAGSYSANLLGDVNSRLPGILAAALLSAVASGQFAGVLILNGVFSFFSFAIASISFPILAGRTDTAARTADLGLACRLNFTATLLALAVFMIFFEPLCKLLLGADFANRQFNALCAAALLCTLLHSTVRILCTDFAAQGRPFLNALLNVPSIFVFAALFWLLGARLAEWGAVAAVCAASVCFSTLTFLLHRASSGLRLRDVTLLRLSDIRQMRDLARSIGTGRP